MRELGELRTDPPHPRGVPGAGAAAGVRGGHRRRHRGARGATPGAALLATTDLADRGRPLPAALGRAGRHRLEGDGRQPLRHRRHGRRAALGAGRAGRARPTRPPTTWTPSTRACAEAARAARAWPSWAATPRPSPRGWLVNVTLLGEHAGRPRLRSAARAGDAIAVTGTLGALGGRARRARDAGRRGAATRACPRRAIAEVTRAHLRPRARVAEGQWLGAAPGVHAMMDCSDGLATDLGHICRESGGGGARDAGSGPDRVRRARPRRARSGREPLRVGHGRRRGLRAPAHL